MRGMRLLVGLVGALALSACSDVIFKPAFQSYQVYLEPAQLGYEVDQKGQIIIVVNKAYVQVAPGAPEGFLESYEYTVLDDAGNEVFPGESLGSGTVGIRIPPGRKEVGGGNFVYETTKSDPFTFSLDGRVAQEHLAQGAPLNWRYQVTWHARTSNGKEISWVQEYQIKYPLRGQ
nr:hypothetical protein [Thermus scotoductus]